MKKAKSKPPSRNYDWLILLAIVAVAFIVRVYGQLDKVFVQGHVIFREVDPYYQMRIAENMAFNWPHILRLDYYAQYPNGAINGYGVVLPFIVSTVSLIIGLGHPSIHLIDTVGAWFPPIAACLVVVVVYFLGREVFKSRFVGAVGALLVAIMPTEFMHRSLLGFTDHHVLEVLFAASTLLFLILTINRKKWWFGVGALISFILYALNWIGWPMLLGPVGLWAIVYYLSKLYRIKRTYALSIASLLVAVFAILLITSPIVRGWGMAFLSNTFLGFTGTIQEVSPMRFKDYWFLFGMSGLLMFGGMFLAIKSRVNSLFLTWSIFYLLSMVMEKRWGYYGTIPVGLFSAYFIYWCGQNVFKHWKSYILGYASIVVIASCLQYGYFLETKPNDITADWYNASVWLRYETPEPFHSDDFLYRYTDKASWGVLSWWDYGHWIIEVGHRVPVSSPTQQESQKYYPFFVATTDAEANKVLEGSNIQYVIIDDMMVTLKWAAIQQKVLGNMDNFQERVKQSMAYRMYYNGKADGWEDVANFGTVKIFRRVN